jgi:hypothetical protein
MTNEKHSAESRINDGGPAYPSDNFGQDAQRGMSLRDWFAGMALQGMLASEWEDSPTHGGEWAYKYADAMIAARKPAEQSCEYCGGCGMLHGKEPDDDVMNTPCPRCNPHAEPEWIPWHGDAPPVDRGDVVAVKYRDGSFSPPCEYNGTNISWAHYGIPSDIIAYRIGGKP